MQSRLYLGNVGGFLSFRTFFYFEFDRLAFFEGFVAIPGYGAEMNENVISVFRSYKAVTFFVVEPFDSALYHFRYLLLRESGQVMKKTARLKSYALR